MQEKVKLLSEQFYNETREYRRYLHMYPELSFTEFQTTEFLIDILSKFEGIKIYRQFSETGLVAKIEGKNSQKRSVALRADIDALPITETNDIPYKSKNDGIMHACGHDVHTASLLTACRILSLLREDFEGTIWCIFQPAEEKLPGGAKKMIDNGLLEFIKPDFVIGQHVMPDLEAGKVGVKEGNFMASTDEIYIRLKGRGGHAALPFKLNDVVVAQANLITTLQTIVSRVIPANIPSVLSFGKVIANGATNIIPDEVILEGTFRIMNEKWRKNALEKIKELSENIASAYGVSVEVEIVSGYPVLQNDPIIAEKFRTVAKEFLGVQNVVNIKERMTGEDFAYFSQKVPSLFYRLGTANKEVPETLNALHSSNFNVDETVLSFSPALLVLSAISI